MEQIHSLLKRQLRPYFSSADSLPKEYPGFIEAVNNAYWQFDTDRAMLERSLELSSQELIQANSDMRAVFERIINSSVDGILAFDRNCRYTVWNPGMERITGVSEKEALGKRAFDVFPPFRETAEDRFFSEAFAGKTIIAKERPYTILGTGKQGFFEGHFSPLRNESGEIIGGLAIIRDITERKQAEKALQESEMRFRSVTQSANDAIIAANSRGKIIFWNKGAQTIFGYSEEEVLGKPLTVLMPQQYRDDHLIGLERMRSTGQSRVIGKTVELHGLRKNGSKFPLELCLATWKIEEEIFYSGIIRDITDRKRAEETIKHQAYYDTLTGLPNRTLFQDRLEQVIHTGMREKKPAAVLLLDLDRFKEINNTLGHHRGDSLLQLMGPRLQEILRESDTVARFGGDEFAVLLPNTDSEGASHAARKILKALEPPFMIEGLPINVETSIGIAVYPDHGENPNTLIQRADTSMYTAKRTGCGNAIYAPEQDEHSPRRLALMGELRQAIEQNQLCLHYQPKISLKTGRIIGVEALVRWQHPQHGMIPPDQFIVPAEQTGLIKPLTSWILNTALLQCRAWHEMGLEISLAVNLSVRSLQDPQLSDEIAKLLRACEVAPGALELEITESAIMADPGHVMGVVNRLSQMGIVLSIDDFGTGYSSLAYLKRLPVGEIKIDKSFVRDMIGNDNDAVIVRSTIDLGHNLGLKVVAEGVENREIWDRLAALGCDAAQGYFMSRPIPPGELARWLSESPWGVERVLGEAGSEVG